MSLARYLSKLAALINSDGQVTPTTLSTGHPTWDSSGNVGVGTSSPLGKFGVVSGATFTGVAPDTYSSMVIGPRPANDGTSSLILSYGTSSTYGTNYWKIDSAAATFSIWQLANERLRIDSAGNVGINNAPTAAGGALQVVNNTTNAASARFTGNANGMSVLNQTGLTVYTNLSGGVVDTTFVAGNLSGTYMAFGIHNGTSYNERMRIDSGGYVGIGTNSPLYKLHVAGDVYTSGAIYGNGGFLCNFTSDINANATNRQAGVWGSYGSAATNGPTNSGILWHGLSNAGDGGQFWQDYNSGTVYTRKRWGGSWGAWSAI